MTIRLLFICLGLLEILEPVAIMDIRLAMTRAAAIIPVRPMKAIRIASTFI